MSCLKLGQGEQGAVTMEDPGMGGKNDSMADMDCPVYPRCGDGYIAVFLVELAGFQQVNEIWRIIVMGYRIIHMHKQEWLRDK